MHGRVAQKKVCTEESQKMRENTRTETIAVVDRDYTSIESINQQIDDGPMKTVLGLSQPIFRTVMHAMTELGGHSSLYLPFFNTVAAVYGVGNSAKLRVVACMHGGGGGWCACAWTRRRDVRRG